jgi:flavin-dependent dehydrogenase
LSDVDIIATGPKRADAGAFGAVYEGVDFPRDKFFMMYDDRFSPRGWYFYVIPFAENKVEVVNCVSQPHVPKAKELFFKALEERKVLREYFAGKKPVSTFAGFGNVAIPRSAVQEGRILTGEAAGFQDPFRGFGMNFALESGKLAADAIVGGGNYDTLWKRQFTNQFQLDFSRRFFISVFGSRLVDLMYRNVKSGDTIGFKSGDVKGLLGAALKSAFYNAERVKKKITGCW